MLEADGLSIDSDGLSLEAAYYRAGKASGPAAVICHPHPQFGGSMDNNVVYGVRDALLDAGISVLTFNFRGVGGSSGRYDHMKGEVGDVAAALEYVSSREDVDRVFLVGYSFGGLMSLYAVADGARPAALALISPMPPGLSFAKDKRLAGFFKTDMPVLVIAGTRDMFCPGPVVKGLVEACEDRTRFISLKGADHFFMGLEDEIGAEAAGFLEDNLSTNDTKGG